MKILKSKILAVSIPGNFYAGKYYDYTTKKFYVLASSPEEAIGLVKKYKGKVVEYFSSITINGKAFLRQRKTAPEKNLFFNDLNINYVEPSKLIRGRALDKEGNLVNVEVSDEESNESWDILSKISKIITE